MTVPPQIAPPDRGWLKDRAALLAVVDALVKVDPVYDYITCFFCGCLTPESPGPSHRGPRFSEGDDQHAEDCAYWMARQLRGLPPWPEQNS